MNNFFRALIAGAAAKKFGGGCLGTIVIFALVWVALGQCSSNFPARKSPKPVIKEKEVKTSSIYTTSYRPYFIVAGESILDNTLKDYSLAINQM